MEAITPDIDAAVRFSSWHEEAGLSRSTAFRLLAISGVELEKRRVDGSRAPVSFVTADQRAKLDFLALELKSGKTLPELESRIVKAQTVSGHPETVQDSTPDPLAKPAQLLQRLQALKLAQETGLGLSTQELAWLIGAKPGSASFVRGKVLVERQARNVWSVQAVVDG